MKGILKKIRSKIIKRRNIYYDLKAFSKASKVLDVGCGQGHFLRLLGKRGIGIDGSDDNVRFCKKAGLDVYKIHLPSDLPFPDGYFDGVYISHVIEHFCPKDAIKIINEIDRVLQRGGVLAIRSPIFSDAFFDDPTHVRPYHLHAIYHLLGGWKEVGSRQMIIAYECPKYELKSYHEEIIPFYTSKIAPTIAPFGFPFRLIMRGISHLLTYFMIGRKGEYFAALLKKH